MADHNAPMDDEDGQVNDSRGGRYPDDDDEDMDMGRGRQRERDDDGGAPVPMDKGGKVRDYDNKIIIEISDEDAAFILGKGGRTKEKLARVSGARIELYERSRTLEIMGPPEARARAKKYVEAVMAQRVGPVPIDENDAQGDLTVVLVPHEAVGFVTGAQGNFLRTIEEEWGTLMFFADYRGRRGPGGGVSGETEKLAIFGPKRGRRGAHLKVLAAVETKVPGFSDNLSFPDDDDDFGTDTRRLGDKELSYALGKKGGTRKKLAASSGCIVEYIGNVVYMCGTREERDRASTYLTWLFQQLEGPVFVDYQSRDDCTVVDVPRDTVGYVTGARRATLGRIEEEWGARPCFPPLPAPCTHACIMRAVAPLAPPPPGCCRRHAHVLHGDPHEPRRAGGGGSCERHGEARHFRAAPRPPRRRAQGALLREPSWPAPRAVHGLLMIIPTPCRSCPPWRRRTPATSPPTWAST